MALTEGDSAPDFQLPADGGEEVSLASLKGKIVVLYFYPKDDTTGCTREGIEFSEKLPEFEALGAEVIGMSADSATKHDKFKKKHGLRVTLVSDQELSTLEQYGVWVEKSMYGKKYTGIERTTLLIDRDGKIAKIWPKVKVPGHVEAVLEETKKIA